MGGVPLVSIPSLLAPAFLLFSNYKILSKVVCFFFISSIPASLGNHILPSPCFLYIPPVPSPVDFCYSSAHFFVLKELNTEDTSSYIELYLILKPQG